MTQYHQMRRARRRGRLLQPGFIAVLTAVALALTVAAHHH